MKTVFSLFIVASLAACSSGELAYNLAQQADNERCMDRVNNENKMDCRNDDQNYDEYKKQREALLNEDSQ